MYFGDKATLHPSHAHDASLRIQADSAADVKSALHEIGLGDRAGWVAAAALYGAGGAVFTVLGLLHVVPGGIEKLAMFALTVSLICVYGMRNWQNRPAATHMRTTTGLLIIITGSWIAGPLAAAMNMIPLFIFFTPVYLYGTRFAMPYAVTLLAYAAVVMTSAPGPQTTSRGIILVGSMLMIVASMMASEQRTRSLATRNRRLAYTDPLTGIANTRRLRENLTEALQRRDGDGHGIALFAMDLDNFKLVNDLFDHNTGDRVLQAVASELVTELHPGDLVARRGGDEFSVLVTDTRGRDLDALANGLRAAITRARIAVCPTITPSGGVAYVEARDGERLSLVLQRADDQLHFVKRAFHDQYGERESIDVGERGSNEPVGASDATDPEDGNRPVLIERTIGALNDHMIAVNPNWGFAVFTFFPIGVVVAILALLGLFEPLSRAAGGLIGVGFVGLSICSYLAGRKSLPTKYLHPIWISCLGLLTAAIALAGDAGGSLIDIYSVLMMYGFYFFAPRVALLYAIACALLFGSFAVGAGYVDAGARVSVTMTVMAVGIGLVVKVRSVTVRFARTNRELSEIDALTGLANVRALRSRVATAVGVAESGGPRPALIAVDLDKFKHVNDTYNHTIGDEVLVAVARAISEAVRVDDLVARRGGDEFVVLCTLDDAAQLDALAERLGDAIVHARLRICPDLTATASIGWSAWEDFEDAEALLKRSDLALHDAKIRACRSDDQSSISAIS